MSDVHKIETGGDPPEREAGDWTVKEQVYHCPVMDLTFNFHLNGAGEPRLSVYGESLPEVCFGNRTLVFKGGLCDGGGGAMGPMACSRPPLKGV